MHRITDARERRTFLGVVGISTSEWANGTYILSLQSGKDVKTKKFVVQHS